jgi:PKD repeat protein
MQKSTINKFGVFYLTFLMLALTFSLSYSETPTKDEMALVCNNWLSNIVFQRGAWGGSITPSIGETQDLIMNDTLVGRYFAIEPIGYVIIPNLKELAPVKAYSDENRLDFSEPDGMAVMIKEVLQDRIRLFVQAYGSMEITQPIKGNVLYGVEQRETWDKYAILPEQFKTELNAGNFKMAKDAGPLLTTVWHQGAPYNNLCPWGDGGRTVVGCVATATAQILAYHRWPLEGTGTHIYGWSGDNSCGGNTTGAALSADYNDPYDWDNIPNLCSPACNTAEQNALAELNYEVGVAFNMDYGTCGSGAYTSDAQFVFPTYFRYYDHVEYHERYEYSILAWSDMIREEIEVNRPIQYRISKHSIVCDGWRVVEPIHQVHMNYGWGGSQNAWFTIDNLYCNWEGCSYLVEAMLTKIEPDRGVQFTADTTWGYSPLDVKFTGSSSLPVDQWIWDFGDGDSAFVQAPDHNYDTPGRFNVKLRIISGAETRDYNATNYITVLNDSIVGFDAKGKPDSSFAMTIYARNTVQLRKIQIPITYAGPLNLSLDSFSTSGCRTDYMDEKTYAHLDPGEKQATLSFYNWSVNKPELEPGYGPVVKVYFTIPSYSPMDQPNPILIETYSEYMPWYYGPILEFSPIAVGGNISVLYVCGDANGSESVNIQDITFLINYLYKGGAAPSPIMAGDANGGGTVNIADITYLINYLYKGGLAPICP